LKLFRDSSVFHLIVACNGIVASPGLSRRVGWKIGMHLNIKSFWSLKEAVSLYWVGFEVRETGSLRAMECSSRWWRGTFDCWCCF
jgi:hypothetical protein